MPATAPYIPPADSLFQAWYLQFSTTLSATPAVYGLDAPTAAAVAADYANWNAAYVTATTEATRTKPTVAAKDAQRAASLALVRPLAVAISKNLGISNEAKAAIGVTVPNLTPTPIPAPSTSPIIAIVAATPLQQTLRYADQDTPDARAKPFGATGMEVWVYVGTTTPTGPEVASFRGIATKQPYAINYDSGDAGKTAFIWARWITATGLTGPWSAMISFTIVGT